MEENKIDWNTVMLLAFWLCVIGIGYASIAYEERMKSDEIKLKLEYKIDSLKLYDSTQPRSKR